MIPATESLSASVRVTVGAVCRGDPMIIMMMIGRTPGPGRRYLIRDRDGTRLRLRLPVPGSPATQLCHDVPAWPCEPTGESTGSLRLPLCHWQPASGCLRDSLSHGDSEAAATAGSTAS
eukprot:3525186-Rhodomonas_salina.2